MVYREELNLNSIAENFEMSRPAISQHIKLLQECDLITISQRGRERYCILKPQKLKEVESWLEPFRQMWESRFDELDNLLNKMKSDNKL
jgi:DNA-binding transcriptional ArsR family regulator